MSDSLPTIRTATRDDAPGLAALLRSIGLFARIEAEPPETTLEYITCHLDACLADNSHTVLVADEGSGILSGYAAVHWLPYLIMSGPEGFISELFIKEKSRGQGLGTRLLATIEQEARSRGCSRLQLVNFRDRESYQRGFYSKRGWNEREDGASFTLKLDS